MIDPKEHYNPSTRKIIHSPESWEAELIELYTKAQIEDFIFDTLAEIGQEHPEISDESRNGMQVYANRLLEKLKDDSSFSKQNVQSEENT